MVKRYSFLLLLLCGSLASMAQQRVVHYIQAEAPIDIIGQRHMTEAVRDVDPNAELFFHFDDLSIVQINASPIVPIGEIKSSIATYGIALREAAPVITPQPQVNTTPDGRPLYVLTGNEAADRAAYQQAVETWNANNPNDRIEMPATVE